MNMDRMPNSPDHQRLDEHAAVGCILSRLAAAVYFLIDVDSWSLGSPPSPHAPETLRRRFDVIRAYVIVMDQLLLSQDRVSLEPTLVKLRTSLYRLEETYVRISQPAPLTALEANDAYCAIRESYIDITSALRDLGALLGLHIHRVTDQPAWHAKYFDLILNRLAALLAARGVDSGNSK